MRQFAIAVIILALVSLPVALIWVRSDTTATAAQSSDAPLDASSQFQQVKPAPGDGAGTDTGVYFPSVSGPHSEITGSVVGDQPGPQSFYIGTVDAQGHKRFWHGLTDANGHFHFLVPALAGLTGLALFTHFDKHGQPDAGSDCRVTDGPVHLPGGQALTNIPATGPAITEGYSAYELGGKTQGELQVLTRGGDPLQEKMLLNGSDRNIDTLASSDRALVGKLHDATQPGFYRTSFSSGNQHSNDMPTSVVRVTYDPLPPIKTGQVEPVRMHIDGLRPQDAAVVIFNVGGAATVADGSTTATVPVKDGLAEVLIRGVRPGALEVVTDLEVHQPERPPIVAQELATGPTELPTTKAHSTEGEPTPTPPLVGVTPTPALVRTTPTPAEAQCSYYVEDGNLEPTQGVWQDDYVFDDHVGKAITRDEDETEKLHYPVFNAQLPMVAGRDTLIFAMVPFRFARSPLLPRVPGNRDHIAMVVDSDCKTFVPVRLQFTLQQPGAPDAQIYLSQVIRSIPLDPPRRPTFGKYVVDLDALYGVPPPPNKPFTFRALKDNTYRIVAQLVRDGGAPFPGLTMAVHGTVNETELPEIVFRPVYLRATPPPDLIKKTSTLETMAKAMIGDYYPIVPSSVRFVMAPATHITLDHIYDPDGFEKQITASAFVGGSGRVVVVLDSEEYKDIDYADMFNSESNGESFPKVAVVRDDVTYKTVIHELTHTFPYIWSTDEMIKECSAPGDYHGLIGRNPQGRPTKHGHVSFGERMYVGGRPDRFRVSEFWAYMTLTGEDDVYASQCDFWHLANQLEKKTDPPMLLVGGRLSNSHGVISGAFDPFYDVVSDADVASVQGSAWSIAVLGEDGRVIATYPIRSPFTNNEDERPLPVGRFLYPLPDPDGAVTIRLSGPGITLTRKLAAQRPVVTIASPSDAAVVTPLRGRVHIAWQASVPSGGKPLASVYYGGDQTPLIEQLFEKTASSFDVELDPRAHSHTVKVVVTDGTRSGESTITFSTR
ncbi:MAG: hypothetical protein JO219_04635 [Candidatus Eremiobacteraeota bacterium]|nr:hypothetical protein [Candidatus Eremiobacteraeota bacterium]